MRVAFRLDASPRLGLGHAMRCLTLADALKPRGATSRFMCRELPDSMRNEIERRGHDVIRFASAGEAATVVGAGMAQDAVDSLDALAGLRHDWLVVDHYGLGTQWETQMRQRVDRVLAIDDEPLRPHDCDLLLDQNLHSGNDIAARYAGFIPAHARSLLGPRFALLRPEFARLRERIRPRSGAVRRILVLFGGVDLPNFTGRALAALEQVRFDGMQVDVVIGAEHPRLADIRDGSTQHGYRCHVQSNDVAQLMASADLSLGAGGSTSWERCCLGLATVCVSFAENQRPIAEALERAGACVYVGDEDSATQSRIATTLAALFANGARVHEMSTNAFGLVDGKGAARVCDAIEGRA